MPNSRITVHLKRQGLRNSSISRRLSAVRFYNFARRRPVTTNPAVKAGPRINDAYQGTDKIKPHSFKRKRDDPQSLRDKVKRPELFTAVGQAE